MQNLILTMVAAESDISYMLGTLRFSNTLLIDCISVYLCSPEVIETSGMKLKPGVVMIESIKSKSYPTFCRIEQMFIVNNEVLLGVKCLDILEYSIHYHSWIVEEKERCQLILPAKKILTKQVLTLCPVRNTFLNNFF